MTLLILSLDECVYIGMSQNTSQHEQDGPGTLGNDEHLDTRLAYAQSNQSGTSNGMRHSR